MAETRTSTEKFLSLFYGTKFKLVWRETRKKQADGKNRKGKGQLDLVGQNSDFVAVWLQLDWGSFLRFTEVLGWWISFENCDNVWLDSEASLQLESISFFKAQDEKTSNSSGKAWRFFQNLSNFSNSSLPTTHQVHNNKLPNSSKQ